MTLYRQRVVRSPLFGAISVGLYLGGIALPHVTASTIFGFQSFDGTANVSVATALAIPGFASVDCGTSGNMGPESQTQAVDLVDVVARLMHGLAGVTVLWSGRHGVRRPQGHVWDLEYDGERDVG